MELLRSGLTLRRKALKSLSAKETGNFRRESVEGRRNDASQPYRFGSRSVPRRSFSFDFAELVSPHTHSLRGLSSHPYIESGNRFSVLMYRPRVSRRAQVGCTGQTKRNY